MSSRTIAYIRVSTIRQDVENQRFEILNYAERNDLQIDEFVGETISGYKSQLRDRRFSDVLADLERGDTLIVSETSRISRRLMDVLNIITDLADRGIRVIAVKENKGDFSTSCN